MAPFADDLLLDLLRRHGVELIFGGESFLPSSFCGLGWVNSRLSINTSADFYLQLDVNRFTIDVHNASQLTSFLDEIGSSLESISLDTTNLVVCSRGEEEEEGCDGRWLLTSLQTAQLLQSEYRLRHLQLTEQLVGEQKRINSCQEACLFPGKLLLPDEERMVLMSATLSDNNVFSVQSFELGQTEGAVDFSKLDEWTASSSSTPESEQTAGNGRKLKLSDFTQVKRKFETDGRYCVLSWPLNGSEIFLLDRIVFPSSRREVLSLLLYCNLPSAMAEAALQVDYFSDGRILPYGQSVVLSREAFRQAVLFVNIPPLDEMAVDEDGRTKIRIIVSDVQTSSLLAVLSVQVLFRFGSVLQQQQRHEQGQVKGREAYVRSIIHSEMFRLTRNNFYALLNALNLTSVAVEVGVCEGEFSLNMLQNWRGER